MNKNCIFCNNSNIKNREILRNKYAMSFLTNIPIVPGHVLICPIRCVAKIEEMTKEEIFAILDLRKKIGKALVDMFKAEGFNYAWNENEIAGQSVPHFHLHVLPRKTGDTGINEYEPRKFLYRPGSRETSQENELQSVAKEIKKFIKNE